MATILSHPAVPLALGLALGHKRVPWQLLVLGMLCSILPDIDVLSFRMGIPYGSPFGHRGATHSLIAGTLMGLLCALLFKQLKTQPLNAFLFITFATISHGILDAMTIGGMGVEFLWPFKQQRYFFPFQFIPASPIGQQFFSARGIAVLKEELLLIWLPCLFFAVGAQFIHLKKS
jgi:inner membrane protein